MNKKDFEELIEKLEKIANDLEATNLKYEQLFSKLEEKHEIMEHKINRFMDSIGISYEML
jgi:tetrahydromethanopterin S-methyltransferase subunit G